MHGRFENVEPAHFETFEWIFDETYGFHVDDAKPVDKFNDREKPSEVDDDPKAEDDGPEAKGDGESTSNWSDSEDDTEPNVDSKTRFRGGDHDCSVREPFLRWLSSGNGIFHISGKLGSGKSTLMKFLCDHERTTVELQKWAGMYSALNFSVLVRLYHMSTG